nr:hypothetical protein [Elizabethkingia bruuniana]
MKKIIISALLLSGVLGYSQNKNAFGEKEHVFTKQDSLFGSNTKYRDFWDVKKYDIEAEPNFAQKSVKGSNRISFSITKDVNNPIFQIDIQQPMKVSNVMSDFEITSQKRDGNFLFVQSKGSFKRVTITLSAWISKEILLLPKEHHGMEAGFSLRMPPENHG